MKNLLYLIPAAVLLAVIVFIYAEGKNENAPAKTEGNIKLLPPETSGGMPLMEALSKRHSSRNFSDRKLSDQTLSNLLWAANGINRKESGKRTAPTANDNRSMDVYAVMESGAYKYNPEEHSLELIVETDLRAMTGRQDFTGKAPVNLVYVSDYSKMKSGSDYETYSGAHAGFIGQNVYLYCASAGLGTVIRAWVDKEELGKALNLGSDKKVVLAQTVGFEE
ncbi:MAG: SagB/ThcOx family dehydrogenase [Ignavibacteria bacterium]|nr:SagB/ThcOx family dehydrogenase [Ignavibacteria bacterium]